MITDNGKNAIKRFFGGQINQIGGTLGFGVGTTPATPADGSLDYEVLRTSVVAVNGDVNNDRTVFKGRIEPGQIRYIYEVGLYESTQVATLSRAFNLFAPGGGVWTNGELDPTYARANVNALRVDFLANGTTNAEITGMNENLTEYTDSDQIVAGVYASPNLSSLRIRMGTDDANYFEFVITDLDVGYNVVRVARGTAAITGSPTWESIQYVAVRPSATADGNGYIHLDGLRIEQLASGQLVARSVLEDPIEVDAEIASDVEYALRVAFA